jgi:hypothetical protein
MTDLANANLQVTFSKESDSVGFELELDEVLNNGKSTFSPGDSVYIKVYPGGHNPTHNSTMGNITILATNKYETIPATGFEYLVFARDSEQSVSHIIKDIVDLRWCGYIPNVPPIFGETKISFSEEVSCVMKLIYRTTYDSWKLSGVNVPCRVLVEAINEDEDRYGSITIDFTENEEESTDRVYLTVRDACTQQIIPNATVEINGAVYVTDANGRVDLGPLAAGTYPIRITAENYQDSDKDRIGNDELVIG